MGPKSRDKNGSKPYQWDVYQNALFKVDDEVKEHDNAKPKRFSVIKSYLLEKSETQLARNLKYSKALSDRDPILPWQLIELTHSAPQTGVLTLDLAITYEEHKKLKQHFKESIGQYMARCHAVINRLHTLEHPLVPPFKVVNTENQEVSTSRLVGKVHQIRLFEYSRGWSIIRY